MGVIVTDEYRQSDFSSGVDNFKLLTMALLMVGACFSGVGLIPVLVLLFGLAAGLKGGNTANIKVTSRMLQIGALVSLVGLLIAAAYFYREATSIHQFPDPYNDPKYAEYLNETPLQQALRGDAWHSDYNDFQTALGKYQTSQQDFKERETYFLMSLGGTAALVFCILATEFLWVRPLDRRLHAVREAINSMSRRIPEKPKVGRIMGREALHPFSVADELRKWKQMFDDELITDEEYQAARQRLLQGARP